MFVDLVRKRMSFGYNINDQDNDGDAILHLIDGLSVDMLDFIATYYYDGFCVRALDWKHIPRKYDIAERLMKLGADPTILNNLQKSYYLQTFTECHYCNSISVKRLTDVICISNPNAEQRSTTGNFQSALTCMLEDQVGVADVTESMLHILMKAGYVFRIEDIEKIPAHKKHLAEMIHRYQRTPRCLMELCRNVIRREHPGREIYQLMETIGYSKLLKDYLLMDEIRLPAEMFSRCIPATWARGYMKGLVI